MNSADARQGLRVTVSPGIEAQDYPGIAGAAGVLVAPVPGDPDFWFVRLLSDGGLPLTLQIILSLLEPIPAEVPTAAVGSWNPVPTPRPAPGTATDESSAEDVDPYVRHRAAMSASETFRSSAARPNFANPSRSTATDPPGTAGRDLAFGANRAEINRLRRRIDSVSGRVTALNQSIVQAEADIADTERLLANKRRALEGQHARQAELERNLRAAGEALAAALEGRRVRRAAVQSEQPPAVEVTVRSRTEVEERFLDL